jgi:hypothetical protein
MVDSIAQTMPPSKRLLVVISYSEAATGYRCLDGVVPQRCHPEGTRDLVVFLVTVDEYEIPPPSSSE